jgi:hypothetical protein
MTAVVSDFKDLAAAFAQAWTVRFGDIQKDLIVMEDVSQVCADLGVPDAAIAARVFEILSALIPLARAEAALPWAAEAPRGGPPITEADWSHGAPWAQPAASEEQGE